MQIENSHQQIFWLIEGCITITKCGYTNTEFIGILQWHHMSGVQASQITQNWIVGSGHQQKIIKGLHHCPSVRAMQIDSPHKWPVMKKRFPCHGVYMEWTGPISTAAYPCENLAYAFLLVTHYNDVIMGAVASQITSLTIVYSTVYSGANQRIHQSSASLAFVRGIHRWPANSPHKWPVTRKTFPFDDVIMQTKQGRWTAIACQAREASRLRNTIKKPTPNPTLLLKRDFKT